MSSPYIGIVGSINVDLCFRTPHFPAPGETLTANSHSTSVGGKGANQAVACARLSHCRPLPIRYASFRSETSGSVIGQYAQVFMVGVVGNDTYGKDAIQTLTRNIVDTSRVWTAESESTGTAVILVNEGTGENRIILNPGANQVWSLGHYRLPRVIDVALFQLEIPAQVVYLHLKNVSAKKCITILNPAPAKSLPRDVYRYIDHLIMNESEACILSGRSIAELSFDDCETLCQMFTDWGVQNVVITLGARGAAYMSSETEFQTSLARKVTDVRDTTGAGDTFVGAYAVMVAQMADSGGTFHLKRAVNFAICAAALSVTRHGAMDSIPWADEVALFARSEGLPDKCWDWNQCLKEIYIPENDEEQ